MVYKITLFDLKGKKIKTYEKMPHLKKQERGGGQSPIYVDSDGHEYMKSHLWTLTENLPEGAINEEENEFLSYFADVTEDLPGYMLHGPAKIKPKTYKNCQLLSQKHGGYLQFFDHKTGETHRIAMNSNTYEPVSKV
jgi:hypothetical protein